jgi:hypothetical protein
MTNDNDTDAPDSTGHLRPDKELTDLFRGVVRDMAEQEHGAVKAGVNEALLAYLFRDVPDEVLEYHLQRSDYASIRELKVVVKARQNQSFPGEDNED